MQIKRFSDDDLKGWREERRAKITGSTSKGIVPLSRGADRTPAGFWQLVGEMLTIMPDDDTPMNRGHRLEKDAIEKLADKTGLEFDKGKVIWESDEDSAKAVSPDAAEPGDNPTYAAEVKNLNEGKHFKYLYKQKSFIGNPIDLVPNEQYASYKEQVIQYFVVNDNLKTLYFALHHPDAIYEEHELVIITIHRADVLEDISAQDRIQKDTLERARSIVAELTQEYQHAHTNQPAPPAHQGATTTV